MGVLRLCSTEHCYLKSDARCAHTTSISSPSTSVLHLNHASNPCSQARGQYIPVICAMHRPKSDLSLFRITGVHQLAGPTTLWHWESRPCGKTKEIFVCSWQNFTNSRAPVLSWAPQGYMDGIRTYSSRTASSTSGSGIRIRLSILNILPRWRIYNQGDEEGWSPGYEVEGARALLGIIWRFGQRWAVGYNTCTSSAKVQNLSIFTLPKANKNLNIAHILAVLDVQLSFFKFEVEIIEPVFVTLSGEARLIVILHRVNCGPVSPSKAWAYNAMDNGL